VSTSVPSAQSPLNVHNYDQAKRERCRLPDKACALSHQREENSVMSVRDNYDVAVVGAGPAGSMAARTIAQAGHSALLVEKRQEIGAPVRCAEGVSRAWLGKLVPIDPKWICAQIHGYRFHAPDGIAFTVEPDDTGYILERKIFDRDLANMAAQAGAHVLAKTAARDVLCDEQGASIGVQLDLPPHNSVSVRSKIVIGADGVESQVGRWAGMDTVPRLRDMCSAVQYLMAGLDIDQGICDFYFGTQVAPGGYLWIFPKGNGMANVGIGIAGTRADKIIAQAFLDRFVETNFPTGSILSVISGGVPLAGTLKHIVKDGLMLVGDAAHQAFPHTGGGIETALEAGRLAGEVAVAALQAGDYSGRFLDRYPAEWHHKFGKEMSQSYRIKELLQSFDDNGWNRSAALLAHLDAKSLTAKEVMLAVLREDPGLLLELRHLFVKNPA
jgi:digeranylgeranylglycerophospholipid reductase